MGYSDRLQTIRECDLVSVIKEIADGETINLDAVMDDIEWLIKQVENAEEERIESFHNGYKQGLFDAKMKRLTDLDFPFRVGDKVKIIDAMATDWIGKEAEITKVFQTLPQCYELNVGGGHWLHSTLEKI